LTGEINSSSVDVRIGDPYCNKTIDQVRVWNRSLSSEEIKLLYESSVTYPTQANFSLSETNLGDSDVFYDFYRNETVAAIWYFDKGEGSYAYDETGNNNTGILKNNPTWISDCKYGNCLKFDKTNDYVEIPEDDIFNISESITIEAWVKSYTFVSGDDMDTVVLRNDWGDKKGFFLRTSYDNDKRPSIYIANGTDWFGVGSSDIIEANEWYHLVATRQGSNIKLYINGILNNSRSDFVGDIVHDTGPIYIGTENTDGYGGCNATIDEVKIYPRVLSSEEILCHYANNCSESGFLNETITLGAGYHYYTARASEGENYTTSALLLPLNISKGSTTTRLFLNGTEGNRDYNTSQIANFTVSVDTDYDSIVYLDTNISGWLLQSDTSPLFNFISWIITSYIEDSFCIQ
jgi:hypothetical protein